MSDPALKLTKLLDKVRVASVTCTAWGDTGKGKIVDLLAQRCDIVARGTGGANAGHTIKVGGRTFVTHLIPSGIMHERKLCVIGTGVAFDPDAFCQEFDALTKVGGHVSNIRVSHRANLVLPQHIVLDCIRDSVADEEIGTTMRGIGPCYTDRLARVGLTANDPLNKDAFVAKLRKSLNNARRFLASVNPDRIQKVMHHDRLGNGRYYAGPELIFSEEAIVTRYLEYYELIADFVCDTDALMQNALGKGKRLLLEGSQGNMLSCDHGTYPYVTSCDPSVAGLAKGVGLHESDIDLSLAIVKLYMTRVGNGPFPTELGGIRSAEHCKKTKADEELRDFAGASVNDPDPFIQGIALRIKGGERGATTGRLRRIGGLDLAALRYSLPYSSPGSSVKPLLVITRADVLDACEDIPVSDGYTYRGPAYRFAGAVLRTGDHLPVAIPDPFVLEHCEPVWMRVQGWKRSISDARTVRDLPAELRWITGHLLPLVTGGIRTGVISVGPDREQTIIV